MRCNYPARGPYSRVYKKALFVVLGFGLLVAFQRDYAKQNTHSVEQPVGFVGIAEYTFRHPEVLVGIWFRN